MFAIVRKVLVTFIDPHFIGMIVKTQYTDTPIPNFKINAASDSFLSELALLREIGNFMITHQHSWLRGNLYRM